MPWIGSVPLDRIHVGTLQPWIDHRRKEGAAVGTINHGLKVVRRILNLACLEWVDEYGMTCLASAPRIKLLPDTNKRKPYSISWDEQERLFDLLPPHLANMALLAVNTGCRDGEICKLKWDWLEPVKDLDTYFLRFLVSTLKTVMIRLLYLIRWLGGLLKSSVD